MDNFYNENYNYGNNNNISNGPTQGIPEKYRTLTTGSIIGYQILYAIPLIGFIFLIIHAFDGSFVARRSLARSYFCAMLVTCVIYFIIFAILGTAIYSYNQSFGTVSATSDTLNDLTTSISSKVSKQTSTTMTSDLSYTDDDYEYDLFGDYDYDDSILDADPYELDK